MLDEKALLQKIVSTLKVYIDDGERDPELWKDIKLRVADFDKSGFGYTFTDVVLKKVEKLKGEVSLKKPEKMEGTVGTVKKYSPDPHIRIYPVPCEIKSGWQDAGKRGVCFGKIKISNRWWCIILWDDEDDPDLMKADSITTVDGTFGFEAEPHEV